MEIVTGAGPADEVIFKDVMLILPQAEYEIIRKADQAGVQSITRLFLRKTIAIALSTKS